MNRETQYTELPFNRHLARSIDKDTLLDLLALVEYEQSRLHLLECEFGYSIRKDSVIDLLFEYVLDALHWPLGGAARDRAYELFFESPEYGHAEIAERLQALQQGRALS